MLLRRVARLEFPTELVLRRFPSGERVLASASPVRRLTGEQECVFLRLALADGDAFALAIASDASGWSWPTLGTPPPRVLLYRASADRWHRSELRRLAEPQRRDALYKADLLAA